VARAPTDVELAIVTYLREHGPVHRDPGLRSRGTADVLTMAACSYEGTLGEFRRHLRRARQKGLVHGDLFNVLAAAPDGAPSPPPTTRALPEAQVIDLPEPTDVGPPPSIAATGAAVFGPATPVVHAIARFDRSDEGLRLLAERGLSFGMLLDFSIEIDRERPVRKADPIPGPATRRATGALWIRGFEPAEIAQVLDLSPALAAALCEPLSRLRKVREIVALDMTGHSATEISQTVGLSPATVKRTLRRVGSAVYPGRSAAVALVVDNEGGPGLIGLE
jgi:hypothetical protein